MKKAYNFTMLTLFTTSISLILVLGTSSIILGPKKTEDSIKALFQSSNYERDYSKAVPYPKRTDEDIDSNKNDNVLGTFRTIGDLADTPPLIVPSSGIAPRAAFLFTGLLSEGKHEGIDIWTNLNGTGMDGITYGEGNPVYASCSGYVHNVWEENGDIVVICDELSEIYKDKVPSLKIKTLYGHMADQFSGKVYIYVQKGQRVTKGDFLGYQGNRCYWSPQNIVVHLHFGVYDISVQPQVPMDPTPYIGVSCTTLNQKFEAGVE
jgi:hypothetical protein